ncbi:MAG: T9SS type A sorting domain-containing protein [Bacteroidales bacterium]|nr:T9SS type A sorting domain-containing protein [Bacteroidales bacterium]
MKQMLCTVMLLFLFSIGATAQNVLVVQLNSGTEQSFDLGDNGSVSFEENADEGNKIIILDNEDNTTSFLISAIQKLYFQPTLSIDDFQLAETLFIYPNPARDYIKVANNNNEKQILTVYSLDGRLLIQDKYANDEKIDISLLEKGMYIVKIGSKILKFSKL